MALGKAYIIVCFKEKRHIIVQIFGWSAAEMYRVDLGRFPVLCRRVVAMVTPVVKVLLGELLRADDQQVLGVFLLGCFGEVEGAGDHDRPVDEDNFVMGDGMLRVDVSGNAGVGEKGERRVSLALLTLVEDHLHLDPPPVRLEQGAGDRRRGEGVSLDKDLRPGPIDLLHNGRGAAAVRAEIDRDRREMNAVDIDGAGRRTPEQQYGEEDQGAYGYDRDKATKNSVLDTSGLDRH